MGPAVFVGRPRHALKHFPDHRARAVADMDGDRQILIRRLFVDRPVVGVSKRPVPFDAASVDAGGAAERFYPADFLYCHVRTAPGHDGDVPNPAAGLGALSRHELVVAARQRGFEFDVLRQAAEPDRRKDHLGVDAQLVHVAHASFDIAHFLHRNRARLFLRRVSWSLDWRRRIAVCSRSPRQRCASRSRCLRETSPGSAVKDKIPGRDIAKFRHTLRHGRRNRLHAYFVPFLAVI